MQKSMHMHLTLLLTYEDFADDKNHNNHKTNLPTRQINHQAIKTYGGTGGIATHILNFETRSGQLHALAASLLVN
jgi:hypothetical protein